MTLRISTFTASILVSLSTLAQAPCPADDDENYIFSKTYSPTGQVVGASQQFYDDFGKLRQSQNYDVINNQYWASQVFYDAFGQEIVSTLPAPTNGSGLCHKPGFVTTSGGGTYDDGDAVNNATVGNASQGVLGWYYSDNNTLDAYQATTSYPFSTTVYDDFYPGRVQKVAAPGDEMRLGKGRESETYMLPATNELYFVFGATYYAIDEFTAPAGNIYRNKCEYSTSTNPEINGNLVGDVPLKKEWFYWIEGTSNPERIEIEQVSGAYDAAFSSKDILSGPWETQQQADLLNDANAVRVNTAGYNKQVSIDANGQEGVAFYNERGQVVAAALSGSVNGSNVRTFPVISLANTSGYLEIHLPAGCENSIEMITTSGQSMPAYDVVNMRTGATVYANHTATNPTLSPGLYRVFYKGSDDPAEFTSYTYLDKSTDEVKTTNGKLFGCKYNLNYYEFALSYYNEAGQLTKTIPPEGIDWQADFNNTLPVHRMATTFTYDTRGLLIQIESPDEGKIDYVYSSDGKLRFSQNDLQRQQQVFAYTNYDNLGRPVETGISIYLADDIPYLGTPTQNDLLTYFQNHLGDYTNPGLYQASQFTTEIVDDLDGLTDAYCTQRSYTLYDVADAGFHSATGLSSSQFTQRNLRNNISKTWNDESTTWYSYDAYGRLEWQVQKVTGPGSKSIHYEYDNNGNLAREIYQKHTAGEYFTHQYTYNTIGQLTRVQTSTDGASWKEVAEYHYDPQGRLKREELAENQQGVDYTYTLSGSLKAINSPNLGYTGSTGFKDPGGDGFSNGSNTHFARDYFGMSLDYYLNDYKRSGTFINSGAGHKDYYNGNIGAMRWNTDNPALSESFTTQRMYEYHYDQHNWITAADFGSYAYTECQNYLTLPPPEALCQTIVTGDARDARFTVNADADYRLYNLSYDANGNIETLRRNAYNPSGGFALLVDVLGYNYATSGGKRIDNKLASLSDNAASNSFNDYDDQNGNAFTYNAIGALLTDAPHNNHYEYNAAGLITHVRGISPGTTKVKYYYDEAGQRIKKEDFDNSTGNLEKTTWYLRDGSGAIKAVYTKDGTSGSVDLVELPVNGASRLAVYYPQERESRYELTDHLGNVRHTFLDPYVVNDDFNDGEGDWVGAGQSPNETQLTYTNGLLQVNTTTSYGNAIKELILIGGESYVLTFDIQKNPATTYQLNYLIQDNTTSPFNNFLGGALTDGSHTVNFTCPGTAGDERSIRVMIYVPGFDRTEPHEYTIDNVKLVPTGYTTASDLIASATDYYPFGWEMPGRTYLGTGSNYRFAFQGQERDRETDTEHEFFELRTWDGRIGRWTSPDPYRQFASPYVGMGNNPVIRVDPNGGCVGDDCPDEVEVGDCQCSYMNFDGERITVVANQDEYSEVKFALEDYGDTFWERFTNVEGWWDLAKELIDPEFSDFPSSPFEIHAVVDDYGMIGPGGPVKGVRWLAKLSRQFKNSETAISRLGKFWKYTVKAPASNGNGSYTIYTKIINSEGKTIRWYHDTFDNTGKFIHRGLSNKTHIWWDGVITQGTKTYVPR